MERREGERTSREEEMEGVGKGEFKEPHYLLSSMRSGSISAIFNAVHSSVPVTCLVHSKHSINTG